MVFVMTVYHSAAMNGWNDNEGKTQEMVQPCDLSASEARFLIGAKQLSPVELLTSCLARIEDANEAVNGVVAIDKEGARAAAERAEKAVLAGEELGPLHGLPIGIKDLNDTAGLRTTYGSRLYEQHVPAEDEHLVANLRRKGAIVFAKTNTPEWGAGGNTFNPVYGVSGNPFDVSLTCGGSSGGSAIALSLGMMPLAHGSDNAGSLRIPAAYCGVVGFRPTAGIVASEKRLIGLSHLPVQGPMARTSEDVRLLLRAMATSASIDALATPLDEKDDAPVDVSRLKVAFSQDLGFAPCEEGLRRTFDERTAAFASIFRETAVAHPDFGEVRRVYEILRAVNYIGMFADRQKDKPRQWGPLVQQNLDHAARFSLEDASLAFIEQNRIYQRVQAFFREFDLLITPTVGAYPWPKQDMYPAEIGGEPIANYFDWVGLTYAITLINHPCISIPCGRDDRGLPFGLQIIGRRNADLHLVRVAEAIEKVLAPSPALARPLPDLSYVRTVQVNDRMQPVVAAG